MRIKYIFKLKKENMKVQLTSILMIEWSEMVLMWYECVHPSVGVGDAHADLPGAAHAQYFRLQRHARH